MPPKNLQHILDDTARIVCVCVCACVCVKEEGGGETVRESDDEIVRPRECMTMGEEKMTVKNER